MLNTSSPSRHQVWEMFDRIADRYDLLNHVLSAGIDFSWRQQLLQHLRPYPEQHLLDLATGTGDVALTLCQSPLISQVTGMDLSEQMLALGRKKIEAAGLQERISLVTGDAAEIPAPEQRFDVATISFGIRNVPDVSQTLREMWRVLKPGGRALILEFSTPTLPLMREGYLFYLRHVLPHVGALISGDSQAYRYLNQTIETFPSGQTFCDLVLGAGFSNVSYTPLSLGIATIYQGDRPNELRIDQASEL